MDFVLSEDHLTLQASAASFLDKEVNLSPLLKHGATVAEAGYDQLWAQITELGWPGIVIPESYGGLGMDLVDLCMIVGEMGRTLAPAPFFGTLAGAWAVEAAGSDAQKQMILQDVAAGSLKLALALKGVSGQDIRITTTSNETVLTGSKTFVVDAGSADKIVVRAEDGFYLIDASATGVSIDRLAWRDITREVCTLTLTGVPATRLDGSDTDPWPFIRDRLYLVLAAESAGGTAETLRDTVEYAKQRTAFGRPIGAFQAIKHQLAEIAGTSECATAAVQYAAWALSAGDARGSLAAAMAQSYASETYKAATHRNIQVFGAIGFTWEMKNHLYYKRARGNTELLGAPRQQREEIIQYLENEAA